MFAAFLSYAHENKFQAKLIREELQKHGLPTFQDVKSIEPGTDFREEITEGIARSDCLLVLVSVHSVCSEEVLREIDIAHRLGRKVFPIILDEHALDQPNPMNDRIADIQWITVSSDGLRIENLSQIVRAVRRLRAPTTPVIAFSNLKGGVGKTTLAAHLSSCLSNLDRLSILIVDLDPQANLSQFVLRQRNWEQLLELDKSVLSLFEKSRIQGGVPPGQNLFAVTNEPIEKPNVYDICHEIENSEFAKIAAGKNRKPVYLIPGQFELVKYMFPKNAFALDTLKSNFARSIQAARKEFDVVLIDLNPSSSFMIECALSSATHIVCPIRPDKYSIQGLEGLKLLIDRAFGLRQPPKISAVFNGIPSWEDDFVPFIRANLENPEKLAKRFDDKAKLPAARAVYKVIKDQQSDVHICDTHIPETPMLKAYHEARSGGFFNLSRFERRGTYGSRLANRLMKVAKDLAEFTNADPLSLRSDGENSQKTQAN